MHARSIVRDGVEKKAALCGTKRGGGNCRRLRENRSGPGYVSKLRFDICSILAGALVFGGCWSGSAVFNQRAYEQTVSLKVDALSLMDKATLPFEWAKPEVDAIKVRFAKAYQYTKGLPNLAQAAAEFNTMMEPDGKSFWGFLAKWESEGKLTKSFVEEAKTFISDDFDRIIAIQGGMTRK